MADNISSHLYIFPTNLQESSFFLKAHCTVLHSKTTHVGPDVPSGWDLTGYGCHSRFTKISNEKLIWQPFKGKSFPQVNYFGRKNEHGWNWEASVQSVRARSVPREHHYLPTDGSQKLLRVCCCLWISLTLNKTPTHCSLRYCILRLMHY